MGFVLRFEHGSMPFMRRLQGVIGFPGRASQVVGDARPLNPKL